MQALILAGGKGSRLFPMTLYSPKQLIMVNGRPVIYYVIDHCRRNGVDDFVLCISDNPMKEHFYNALGDGKQLGVNLRYSLGPESLGTAGRLSNASDLIDNDDFVVYYGDIITSFNLREMIDFHRKMRSKNNCLSTLAVSDVVPIDRGVAMNDKVTSRIALFMEKPLVSKITEYKVNVGIAVCNTALLKYCENQFDLFGDVIPIAIQAGEFVSSYNINTIFHDIGTFESLETVMQILKSRETGKNSDFGN